MQRELAHGPHAVPALRPRARSDHGPAGARCVRPSAHRPPSLLWRWGGRARARLESTRAVGGAAGGRGEGRAGGRGFVVDLGAVDDIEHGRAVSVREEGRGVSSQYGRKGGRPRSICAVPRRRSAPPPPGASPPRAAMLPGAGEGGAGGRAHTCGPADRRGGGRPAGGLWAQRRTCP